MTPTEFERLTDMLQAIEPERKALSDWERGFLDDQIKRVEQYGTNTNMSVKQWGVMKRMHEKVTGERDDEPPLEAYDDNAGPSRWHRDD